MQLLEPKDDNKEWQDQDRRSRKNSEVLHAYIEPQLDEDEEADFE